MPLIIASRRRRPDASHHEITRAACHRPFAYPIYLASHVAVAVGCFGFSPAAKPSDMKVFLLGIALFAIAFGVHVVRWRIAPPKGSAAILIRTLVAAIAVAALAALSIDYFIPDAARWFPEGVGAWCESVTLALAIAASYVMTYPAVEVESPSFLIVEFLKEAGVHGVTRQDLHERLNNAALVRPHVQDLLHEGLAVEQGAVLRLTARGRCVAFVFMSWRQMLGATKGG